MRKLFLVLPALLLIVLSGLTGCSSDDNNNTTGDVSITDAVTDTTPQCAALNQACQKTDDCCEGLECNPNTNTCKKPLLDNGNLCSSDDNCKSGLCYGVTANIKNSYCSKTCNTDSDCAGFAGGKNYCCTYDSLDSSKKICIYTDGGCTQKNGEAGASCEKLGNVACKPGETYCVGERDDDGLYKAGSVCSKKCTKSADCTEFGNTIGGYSMNCYECLNSAQYGTAMCIKTDRCVNFCSTEKDCIYPHETSCEYSLAHDGYVCQSCYYGDTCNDDSDCKGDMKCTESKTGSKNGKKYCMSCSPNRFRPDCYGDVTCGENEKCQMSFTLDTTGQSIMGLNTKCGELCELSKGGKKAGEDCLQDDDCCSLFCMEGKCANFCHPSCKKIDESCKVDGDCCSLKCLNNKCVANIDYPDENSVCNYGNGFKGVCRDVGMSLDQAGCTVVNMGICIPTVYQGDKPTQCEKPSDCKVEGEICKLIFGNDENTIDEDNTQAICAKEYSAASKPGQACQASFSCSTNLCLRAGFCSGTCDTVGATCNYGNAGNYNWLCMPQPLSETSEGVIQTNLCIPVEGSGKECNGDKDCSNGEVCKMTGFDDKNHKIISVCSVPTKDSAGQPGAGFDGDCIFCSADEICHEGCIDKPCANDLCLNNGKCSSICKTNSDCPAGYACYESFLGLGTLYQGICIPITEISCNPCSDDAYCNSSNPDYNNPNPSNRCVAVPENGSDKFCLASCDPQVQGACPQDFTCKDVQGINLCVPNSNSCVQ